MTDKKLSATRAAEHAATKAQARTAFEAYWTGSATASVLRDYQAGRATTVRAGRKA